MFSAKYALHLMQPLAISQGSRVSIPRRISDTWIFVALIGVGQILRHSTSLDHCPLTPLTGTSHLPTLRRRSLREAIALASGFDEALGYLQEMLQSQIQPTAVDFNTVLTKAPDFSGGLMILDMMMVQGLQPTIHAITQLIVLAPNRGKALDIFRDFVSEDLRIPDNVMLNALISKCTSFEEGIDDLNLFRLLSSSPGQLHHQHSADADRYIQGTRRFGPNRRKPCNFARSCILPNPHKQVRQRSRGRSDLGRDVSSRAPSRHSRVK